MARKLPPVEHRFKKGQIANPLGAGHPKYTAARNRQELADMLALLSELTPKQARSMIKGGKLSLAEKTALTQLLLASDGSGAAFDRTFDRIVGKVQEDIKVSADVDVRISSEQLAAAANAALKRVKGGNE
jgi:hypothetical protein